MTGPKASGRLEKMREDDGIKVSSVASSVTAVSAPAKVAALTAGEAWPWGLGITGRREVAGQDPRPCSGGWPRSSPTISGRSAGSANAIWRPWPACASSKPEPLPRRRTPTPNQAHSGPTENKDHAETALDHAWGPRW